MTARGSSTGHRVARRAASSAAIASNHGPDPSRQGTSKATEDSKRGPTVALAVHRHSATHFLLALPLPPRHDADYRSAAVVDEGAAEGSLTGVPRISDGCPFIAEEATR